MSFLQQIQNIFQKILTQWSATISFANPFAKLKAFKSSNKAQEPTAETVVGTAIVRTVDACVSAEALTG